MNYKQHLSTEKYLKKEILTNCPPELYIISGGKKSHYKYTSIEDVTIPSALLVEEPYKLIIL